MQIKHLTLANVRAFKQAEFEFQPKMNLLVGVNGAGKSTVLEVIRRMYAKLLLQGAKGNQITSWNRETDIAFEQPFLTVNATIDFYGQALTYTLQLQRDDFALKPDAAEGQVRKTTINLPERDELRSGDGRLISGLHFNPATPPLAVFFSPHRALIESSRTTARTTKSRALTGALERRGLDYQELALWWTAQEDLQKEMRSKPMLMEELQPAYLLKVLNDALHIFFDTYGEVYAVSDPRPALKIKKDGKILDVFQLSDGERSMIALVLDLARRLALANPESSDPLQEGAAVVLIDEIDLHLHPGWQRTICDQLTKTFPKCQFIATTHSPQIVGEVLPGNISMIADGKPFRPRQSLGMDTNWILEHLMGVPERRSSNQRALEIIEALIESEDYGAAMERIAEAREELGDFPQLAALQAHVEMIKFLANEENEAE